MANVQSQSSTVIIFNTKEEHVKDQQLLIVSLQQQSLKMLFVLKNSALLKTNAQIYCEAFIQWVVEDRFAAGLPKWEEVCVQFTDDVIPYENMKLWLLNASYKLLSYPSFYQVYSKVDEAMADKRVEKYLRDFMNIDITPYVPDPKGINLTEYKDILIAHFASRPVGDQVARLCFDGTAKVHVFIDGQCGITRN